MKYYILDLSADNSLVKYLVDQGHTVFIASWRNPSAEDRDLGFDDYIQMGALDAIEAVRGLTDESQLHLCGYCLGGTLASIAAAALARKADNPLLSLTLLAAQVDFREAGELSLFISDSQLALLEDLMWDQGYLDKNQMGGAFQILRSNDLVWSRMLHRYWEGERSPAFDLMAWNADGTRMPYRMHSEYLRSLYLENDLAEGRFEVDGEVISISDINVPIFAVSTDHDHVAPWHSVYKIHILGDTETTFVLTTGGHNAGIVSEPGHKGRSFKIARTNHGTPFIPPDVWEKRAEEKDGSWWIDWEAWLSKQSDETCPAREPHLSERTDNMLIRTIKAPGTYVHQQ